MTRDILALYRQHLAEQKEAAFMRWRASGYRDQQARAAFVAAFVKMQETSNARHAHKETTI